MHVAVFAAPFQSHVAAAAALADALARRGHRATLLQRDEVEALVPRGSALGFAGLGRPDGAIADLSAVLARSARPAGPFGIRRTVRDMAAAVDWTSRAAPDVLDMIGADAALVDQMEPVGAAIALRAGLPYVSFASALPIEREPAVPLPMLSWPYDPSAAGLRRNRGGTAVADLLMRPLHRAVGRALRSDESVRLDALVSARLSVWQIVTAFDFPRDSPSPAVRAVGPFRSRRPLPATLGLRSGRPLVYASLGTLQGHRLGLFRRIAHACRLAGADVVVSHCGRLGAAAAERIGATHAVAWLDQRAAVREADVVVTHAGLNTVLDAAEAGRPVLALPIAFDQPGVAARAVHTGMGIALGHRTATAGTIGRALGRLLGEPSFAAAAGRIGAAIEAGGGADRAAALIEAALTGSPSRRIVA